MGYILTFIVLCWLLGIGDAYKEEELKQGFRDTFRS